MVLVADEGVDRGIVARLRADGHEVLYIAEIAPGIADEAVGGRTQGPQRFVYSRTEGGGMKTVDLRSEQRSLSEVLALAKSEAVLIRSPGGEEFLVEPAGEFDREIASLGSSERFLSFLDARSKETGDMPIRDVREKRRI
jgi:hypothetical protein